jgi:Sulfotransferase family
VAGTTQNSVMIGPKGESLAILLGVPRSGTTLLSHLLDRHPQIASPPEPWLLLATEAVGEVHPLHPADSSILRQAYADFVSGLDVGAAKAAFATTLYRDFLRREGKSIFVDKTPRYHFIADRIAQQLPESLFIYLKRDPFSVVASLKTTWNFDLLGALAVPDNEFLFDLALGYRWLRQFAEDNPSRVLTCSYDHLVGNADDALHSILSFLGADQDGFSAKLDPDSLPLRRGRMGDQKIIETRSIHQNSLGAWRSLLTREEKQAVHDIFSSEGIVDLGYGHLLPLLQVDGISDNGPTRAAEILAKVEETFHGRLAAIAAETRLVSDAEAERHRQIALLTGQRQQLTDQLNKLTIDNEEARLRIEEKDRQIAILAGQRQQQADLLNKLAYSNEELEAHVRELLAAAQLRTEEAGAIEETDRQIALLTGTRRQQADLLSKLAYSNEELHAHIRELLASRWRKLGRRLRLAKAASFED